MKKIVLCVASFILCGMIQAQSQTVTPTSTIIPGGGKDKTKAAPTDRTSVAPPENVTTAFNTEYPGNTNVSWKVKGNNFWVTYTDPKTNLGHVIIYNKEGKIVRRENEVDKLTYPSEISDYYTKQYPKEKFQVWQTERTAGQTYYFITRKGKVLWFDQTGKSVYEPEK